MNVFDLVAKISIDSSEYDRGLDNASNKANGFGSKVKGMFGGVAKVGAAALAAASGAVIAMAKGAVSSYASYEQLVGGVDKLYGDASGKLQQYADKAFMTAGMSANQYMETATSFSAALINSLGGNTQKAADMTDVAMRAMSDNVNVFGSSMDSVQHAFQGFAKQNYTMLDNLKLGYGGTKEEMQRLIDDANKYRKSIGQSSNLSIKKFGDIVQAIQSVQEAQGIAGTTNKEAMRTIEGSANATKAAWQNVITAIGRGEGLDNAMKNLSTALFGQNAGEGLLNQVMPRIQTTMEGIANLVTTAGPMIAQKLPEIANAIIPSLLSTAVSVIEAIGGALPGLVSVLGGSLVSVGINIGNQLINAISTVLNDMFPSLGKGFDGIVSAAKGGIEKVKSVWSTNGVQILSKASEIWSGIQSAVNNVVNSIVGYWNKNSAAILSTATTAWEKVKSVITTAIRVITNYWNQNSSEILAKASETWENIKTIVSTVMSVIGSVIQTVVEFAKQVWETWGADIIEIAVAQWELIGTTISVAIEKIKEIITTAVAIITEFWSQHGEQIMTVASAAWGIISTVITAALNVIKGIIAAVTAAIQGNWSGAWSAILGVLSTIWSTIKTVVSAAISAVASVISSILNSIKATFSNVWNAIKATVSNVINGIKSTISSGLNAAKSTVTSIFNSIKTTITNTINGAKTAVTNAINAIKNAFNFTWSLPHLKLPHISISGSFSLVPPSVPTFGISWYKKAMQDPFLLDGASIFGASGGKLLGGGEAGREIVIGESKAIDLIRKASGDREPINVTINVYARENQDVNALADVISRKLQKQLDRRSAVYA